MTDKERILQIIVNRLSLDTVKNPVKWEMIYGSTKLIPGDVIMCVTNPYHDFSIGFFVQRGKDESEMLVRHIGSTRTSWCTNEFFKVLRGMDSPLSLLCGHEHLFKKKVNMILSRDFYMHILYALDFGPGKVTITTRIKFSEDKKHAEFTYNGPLSRVSMKSIRSFLEKQYPQQ